MIIPDWMKDLEPLWLEWCGNREYLLQKKHVPFNEGVQRAAIRRLTRLRDQGYDVEYVIEEAVQNGWRGFWVNDRTPRIVRKPQAVELSPQHELVLNRIREAEKGSKQRFINDYIAHHKRTA